MGKIEDIAMKIYNVYEDFYFDKEKRKIFDDLFIRYLSVVDLHETTDVYDAIVSLGLRHRFEFDQLVKALKDQSLLIE
jgi:hypothetical protein